MAPGSGRSSSRWARDGGDEGYALAQCNQAIDALSVQLGNANQAVADAEVKRDEVAARLASEEQLKLTLEGSLSWSEQEYELEDFGEHEDPALGAEVPLLGDVELAQAIVEYGERAEREIDPGAYEPLQGLSEDASQLQWVAQAQARQQAAQAGYEAELVGRVSEAAGEYGVSGPAVQEAAGWVDAVRRQVFGESMAAGFDVGQSMAAADQAEPGAIKQALEAQRSRASWPATRPCAPGTRAASRRRTRTRPRAFRRGTTSTSTARLAEAEPGHPGARRAGEAAGRGVEDLPRSPGHAMNAEAAALLKRPETGEETLARLGPGAVRHVGDPGDPPRPEPRPKLLRVVEEGGDVCEFLLDPYYGGYLALEHEAPRASEPWITETVIERFPVFGVRSARARRRRAGGLMPTATVSDGAFAPQLGQVGTFTSADVSNRALAASGDAQHDGRR